MLIFATAAPAGVYWCAAVFFALLIAAKLILDAFERARKDAYERGYDEARAIYTPDDTP